MSKKLENFLTLSIILIVDFLTKIINNSEDWTYHPFNGFPYKTFFIVLFLFVFVYNKYGIFGSIFVGGALGNLLWIMFSGGNPNPFLGQIGEETIAYNFADLCMVISWVPISIMIGIRFERFIKWRFKEKT